MNDNDGAMKRQYDKEHLQPNTDTSTSSTKRFKLNNTNTEDTLSQEPTTGSNDNERHQTSHADRSTVSRTDSSSGTASRNQHDNPSSNTPTTSSSTSTSPFALHPILDELTNKPVYSSYESSGMRMSMSAILTETGKGYHDRSIQSKNNIASSLSPSATSPSSTKSLPYSSTLRGQSLPPANDMNQQQQQRLTSSIQNHYEESNKSSPLLSTQQQQQHHHHHHQRSSSHPTVVSMMHPTPRERPTSSESPHIPSQGQSITNEQLIRALTTSIPMESTSSNVSEIVDANRVTEKHDVTSPNSSASTTTGAPSGLDSSSPSSSSSSLPGIGSTFQRLSGSSKQDLSQQRKDDVSDVSPTEILGSALAAVARSQQHGTNTTAAAAAIGNLAAITANISHLLNNNNNNNNSTNVNTGTSAPTTTSSSTIPTSSQQQQRQQGTNHGITNDDDHSLDDRSSSSKHPSQPPPAISNMLDQAIQLGRTQQLQLKQEGGTKSTRTDQDQMEGMMRAATAVVVNASSGVSGTTTLPTNQTHIPPMPSSHRLDHHDIYRVASSPSINLQHHHLHHRHQQQQQQHHQRHPYQHHPYHPYQPPITKIPQVVVNNDRVWQAVKGKEETCLGFYVYHPSMLLPNLQEHLNGIVQVRIPSRYLTYQNPKVKKRAIWGTGIYTDDSDIVTSKLKHEFGITIIIEYYYCYYYYYLIVAIHSGKYTPHYHDPELESNDPFLLAVAGKTVESIRAASRRKAMSPKTYLHQRDDTLPGHDIKVTLRVLPKLQQYTSTVQHRIKSRQWGGNHDGVSFYVEAVEQIEKGQARLCGRRSLKNHVFRPNYDQHQVISNVVKTGPIVPNNSNSNSNNIS
ncbi:histone deacetylation protein Rxt3-domain-containing protein [Halteromyces radiatus]|uniref:histone deacetylation protein Rxt3-domain-containing protein n=1 Tax=Halteromyces radiatus TaxID=101107 RepID=UPI00221FE298|nr:histone deacetylation protein Rxt3-domain-containing protein [Halteromyces radiatus]KAI8092639.1 histone deacetylation protein Rxt3-domain-containing protein [Halteromyces radiatus]